VTFAAGQTTQTLRVAVIGDRVREKNETFRVTLSNPAGATISNTAWRAIGTILEDDTPGQRAAALRLLAAAAAEADTKKRS
jgi:chitinase